MSKNNKAANKKASASMSTGTGSKVQVGTWNATQLREGCNIHQVVVWLGDGRQGVLTIDLLQAFTDTEDWMTLAVLPEEGEAPSKRSHYTASHISMPESLNKHILRHAVSAAMANVADRLAENRGEIPEFSAYVSAEGMKSGRCEAGEILDLADCLNSIDFDGDAMEGDTTVPALVRLASEFKRLCKGSLDMDQPMSGGKFSRN
jgi:hypothetical protein